MTVKPLFVPAFARLDEYCGVWAIDPTRAAQLWDIASRENMTAHVVHGMAQSREPREPERYEVPGGRSIAVLRAEGLMMKQRSSMGRSTSTVELRREIRQAAADPEVGALLLAVDSPGGTVSGMEELAAEVRAARRSKPVFSFVEDLGASAAYWLASQGEKVYAANKTTMVGSIGTLLTMYDMSGAAEKEGVKALVFATGPLKGTGTPGAPVTEEQQAYLQGIVEQSQAIFDADVRAGRGFNEAQLAAVRTGGVFLAEDARGRSLIDGIQSFDATVQALAARIAKPAATVAARSRTVSVSVPSSGVKVMSFEQYLSARGLAADALSETTLATMRSDWEALTARASGPEDGDEGDGTPRQTVPAGNLAAIKATLETVNAENDLATTRKARAAEQRRIAEIEKICAKNPDIAATAIEEGWEPIKAENAVLKANQRAQGGPWIHMPSGGDRNVDKTTVQAALCLAAGMRQPEKHFKPEALEAAERNCKGWGVQRTILHFAMRNGWQGDPMTAFRVGNEGAVLKAAFSTVDLPNSLSGAAERMAEQGARGQINSLWRQISRIRSVRDFRATSGVSLIEGNTYEKVGQDGEIKHGALSESTWTNRAYTFAKMLVLTFQDIRNDDLGFLGNADALLGRGADRAMNKEAWTEFLDNSTHFTGARGNYASGAGTVLSAASLATFEALFMAQTTEEGDDVGYMPSLLVVPPALGVTAAELYQTTNWNTGGSSTTAQVANANIFAGKYRPLVVPQLSNSAFTGYSTTAWYLLADPQDAPTLEAVFLDGRDTPIVETAEVDFHHVGGVQMKGHIHFGFKLAEYRAGVKSKGAA